MKKSLMQVVTILTLILCLSFSSIAQEEEQGQAFDFVPTNCHTLVGADLATAQSYGLCLEQTHGLPGDFASINVTTTSTCGSGTYELFNNITRSGYATYDIEQNANGPITYISWSLKWNNYNTYINGTKTGGLPVYAWPTYTSIGDINTGNGFVVGTLSGYMVVGGLVHCTMIPVSDSTTVS